MEVKVQATEPKPSNVSHGHESSELLDFLFFLSPKSLGEDG